MSNKRKIRRPRRDPEYAINMEKMQELAANITAGGGPMLDEFLSYDPDVRAVILAHIGLSSRGGEPSLEEIARRVQAWSFFPGATKREFYADMQEQTGLPVDEEYVRAMRDRVSALRHESGCPAPQRSCTCGVGAMVEMVDAMLALD